MKYPIYAVRSLEKILDDLVIPSLKKRGATAMRLDKLTLDDGTEFKFRELVGQCIMSLLQRHFTGEEWVPSTDHQGRDGTTYRSVDGLGVTFEQVYVVDYGEISKEPVVERIRSAMKKKNDRGVAYAENYHLLVFCDAKGEFDPAQLINVPECSNFPACSLIVKVDEKLEYMVCTLKGDSATGHMKYLVQLESKPYGVISSASLLG